MARYVTRIYCFSGISSIECQTGRLSLHFNKSIANIDSTGFSKIRLACYAHIRVFVDETTVSISHKEVNRKKLVFIKRREHPAYIRRWFEKIVAWCILLSVRRGYRFFDLVEWCLFERIKNSLRQLFVYLIATLSMQKVIVSASEVFIFIITQTVKWLKRLVLILSHSKENLAREVCGYKSPQRNYFYVKVKDYLDISIILCTRMKL